MLMVAIFCAVLLRQATTQNFHGNFTGRFPEIDILGNFIGLIEDTLSRSARNRPPPKNEQCKGRLFKFGENEVKISQYPRGNCTYCCPMKNPVHYVRLFFTNKANNGNTVQLKMSRKSGALRAAGLDTNAPTVIFIHGFTEYGLGNAPRIIRDAYLSRPEDHNIILVDWGELTTFPWYPHAVYNSKLLGAILAKFISFYSGTGELSISKLHLVGFSLGAHAAGFAGKLLMGSQRLPRITALDPALPMYPLEDPSQRVAKTDADYVDVIHTDAGKFGYVITLGHADFYPNGGSFVQPGCEVSNLAEYKIIDQLGTCGHQRAWRLYAESVRNPSAFPATSCGVMYKGSLKQCRFVTENYMGFGADNRVSGVFYLTTNIRKPFSKSAKDQERDMRAINLVL